MANLTSEQLQEITDRTGQIPGKSLQSNVMLQDGTIIPADINPGSAATIVLGDPNKVLDRGTSQGAAIARSFEGQNVVDPQKALADALKATPVQPQGVSPPATQGGALVKPPSAPTQTQVDEGASKLIANLNLKGVSQTDINNTLNAYYKGYGL